MVNFISISWIFYTFPGRTIGCDGAYFSGIIQYKCKKSMILNFSEQLIEKL